MSNETPLRQNLNSISLTQAGRGLIYSGVIVALFQLRQYIQGQPTQLSYDGAIEIFLYVSTLVILVFPEGLFIIFTLMLKNTIQQMLYNCSLVRKPEAIEKLGMLDTFMINHDLIMEDWSQVENLVVSDMDLTDNMDSLSQLHPRAKNILLKNLALNNRGTHSYSKDIGIVFNGTQTECAKLKYVYSLDSKIIDKREEEKKSFIRAIIPAHNRNYQTVVIQQKNLIQVHIVGDPKQLFPKCSKYLDNDGDITFIDETFTATIDGYIKKYDTPNKILQLVAYKEQFMSSGSKIPTDEELERSLVFVGLIAVNHRLKYGVTETFKSCIESGVRLVLVEPNGDQASAVKSAIKLGILPKNFNERENMLHILKATTFRKLVRQRMDDDGRNLSANLDHLKEVCQHIKIITGAEITDKLLLIKGFQSQRRQVGDITSEVDGPSAKLANLNFSFGIDASQKFKEISDIILLDDRILSVDKSVRLGRNLFDTIKNVIDQQATSVAVIMILTLLCCLFNGQYYFSKAQLIWFDLVLDISLALAFCTAKSYEVPQNSPRQNQNQIDTLEPGEDIFTQAAFQVILLGSMMLTSMVSGTFIFNTLIYFQLVNWYSLYSDRFNKKTDIKTIIFGNKLFLFSILTVFLATFIISVFLYDLFSMEQITGKELFVSLVLAISSLMFTKFAALEDLPTRVQKRKEKAVKLSQDTKDLIELKILIESNQ